MTGWNGKHCTLPGCPGNCRGQGSCQLEDDTWRCSCQPGWDGEDCSVRLEMNCSDTRDNDRGESGAPGVSQGR